MDWRIVSLCIRSQKVSLSWLNNNSWPKKREKTWIEEVSLCVRHKKVLLGEETFILVIQITSSLCPSLFRLSFDISHYIFGFFQTDREEDKCFYMGDKLAHQKALNKEWNYCTLGYMFRSHGWTLQVLATSHLEAWWWMSLV